MPRLRSGSLCGRQTWRSGPRPVLETPTMRHRRVQVRARTLRGRRRHMRIDRRAVLGAVSAVTVCLGLCGVGQARVPQVVPRPSLVVVDAIGDGGPDADEWNSALATAIRADHPKVLLWAGDVRNEGTAAEWRRYHSLYGPLVNLTLPTPGN